MLVFEIKMTHIDGGFDLIYHSSQEPEINFKLGRLLIVSSYGDVKSVELVYPFTVSLVNLTKNIEEILTDRKLYGNMEQMMGTWNKYLD